MIKYVLSKTIKYKMTKGTVFEGTDIDKTVTFEKGTYVEFIPIAYLSACGVLRECENCDLCDDCESLEEKDELCAECYENNIAQDLLAVFVPKDANMCFKGGEFTPDSSCSSNVKKVLHTERLHYTQIPSFITTYKLVPENIKFKGEPPV